ncbi:MAG: peptide ABC transporter permease [Candidatus Eremiobacter antarcticus]|nr:ABC transporter permease [Candidatus Eremiobacteraeota bacterium]MBC5807902.1 ABC transporter permease [Candidatus Eremiobacteraeota bacterium]PZR62728.1 MAG: peptide ABC transporter permease [Candidatus Eremiobacter sp. RRmetagenome_bin22]
MAGITQTIPSGALLPVQGVEEYPQDRHQTWRKFSRHRLALSGAIVLLLLVFGATAAPWLSHFDPNAIDTQWSGTPLAPGAFGHWIGTDEIGRDLYTRLLFGARISLTLAVFAVVIEVVLGTLIGAVAGYYGGKIDGALMRLTDTFLSIPLLPLLLVITGIVAASSSKAALNFASIVLIIGLLSWMNVARLVRGSFLSLREKEFCEAARAIGSNDSRIVIRHLLPNAVAPIVVQATLDVGNVILLESALSYLGFGIQPPTASWGSMLANAQENITIAPWAAIYPGLCIFITVLAVNYMGDGLRDALDPNVQ